MPEKENIMERQPTEVMQKAKLFQRLWGQHYPEPFVINGATLRWAKELIGVPDDVIVERFNRYVADRWYGEHVRHSLQAFVKNFNSFVKPQNGDGSKPAFNGLVACSACGKVHGVNDKCDVEDMIRENKR